MCPEDEPVPVRCPLDEPCSPEDEPPPAPVWPCIDELDMYPACPWDDMLAFLLVYAGPSAPVVAIVAAVATIWGSGCAVWLGLDTTSSEYTDERLVREVGDAGKGTSVLYRSADARLRSEL